MSGWGVRAMNQSAVQDKKEVIRQRIETRIEAGRNPQLARWHGTLETFFEDVAADLVPGELVTLEDMSPEEETPFNRLLMVLDLPPFVWAVYLPSRLARTITPPPGERPPKPLSGNVCKVLTTWEGDCIRILVSEMTEGRSVINVFEDGSLLASHNYQSMEECLSDISKIIWIHFRHRERWGEDDFARYTEGWFYRSATQKLISLPINPSYSYIHNPVLVGLNIVSAIYRLMRATLNRMTEDVEDTIRRANEVNQYNPETVPLTRNGLAEKEEDQCRSFRIFLDSKLLGLLKLLRGYRIVNFRAFSPSEQLQFKIMFPRMVEESYQTFMERV